LLLEQGCLVGIRFSSAFKELYLKPALAFSMLRGMLEHLAAILPAGGCADGNVEVGENGNIRAFFGLGRGHGNLLQERVASRELLKADTSLMEDAMSL
jgi:hypothetical protein